jgi:crossover junction endodeoxyribonuclease RuvC
MIIIGIDPGTATTGFGILRKNGDNLRVVDYGCINTKPNFSDGERLKIINKEIDKLIKKYKPEIFAVENLYFFKNFKTAIPVSQAKGVILLAAAKRKIPVLEFTPLQMKMAITGYGKADKKQVQKMVRKLLDLEEKPKDKDKRKDDATDALGVALCCAILVNKNKTKLS